MKRIILIASVILFSLQINAKEFYIKGTIPQLKHKPVFISILKGHKRDIVDTVLCNKKGEFTFFLNEKAERGIYKILFKEKNSNKLLERSINIIFNDHNVEFKTDFIRLYNDFEVIKSEENKAYYDFLFQYKEYLNSFGYFQNKLSYYAKDDTVYDKLADRYHKLQKDINYYIDTLTANYPHTIFSKIAQTYKIPNISAYWGQQEKTEYLREHFLDPISFDEPVVLNSSRIPNKLIEYLQFFKDPRLTKDDQDTLYMEAVDHILLKAFINDTVYNYVLNYLLDVFEKHGRQNILSFIAEKANENKCHADEDSKLQQKLSKYRELRVGRKVPDLELKDLFTGEKFSLHEIDAKYTLLLFWGSFCNHCKKELPTYKELYNKYDRNYFEIVAISVDDTKDFYLDYVRDHGYDVWYNYSDFGGWSGKMAKMFNIKFTPNTFLLNSDKKIINRPSIEKLKELLEANN